MPKSVCKHAVLALVFSVICLVAFPALADTEADDAATPPADAPPAETLAADSGEPEAAEPTEPTMDGGMFGEPVPAEEPKSGGIMVWRLEAKTGVSEKDIDSITGIITAEVERHSGRSVISEADLMTILRGEQTRQQCGLGETGCLTEIGAALGVPEVVAGDLGRVGTIWVLNIRRINVRETTVIKRVSRQIDGPIETLVMALPEAVAELFGVYTPQTDVAVSESGGQLNLWQIGAIGSVISGIGLVGFGAVGTWQVKDAKDGNDYERWKTWRALSITGYALGGAAIVTGVVLWFTDPARKNGQQTALDFGAAPTPDGFTVQVGGQF